MTEDLGPLRLWLARVRVRVTLAATAVSLLGAIVGVLIFVGGLHENLESALVGSAQQQAANVEARLKSGATPEQATVSSKRDLIIQVVGSDGTLLATDQPQVTEALRTTPGVSESVHVPTLDDSYAVYARRTADGRLILAGLSEEQVARASRTAVTMLAVAVPIGIALLAAVVWLSIGRALRPVEVMRRQAATITSEHLHKRLEVPPGDDEIPLLASTLNEMLDRIDLAQQQQRQFVSDASHELRSPLATVRQTIEVARRHPDSTTVPHLADAVGAEERRMEELVRALLTLARLDDKEVGPGHVVDVDDAVVHEVSRLRGQEVPVRIDMRHVSAGRALGDAVLFNQVVANLLSNAVRHARTQVRVSLDEEAGATVLLVEDDGDGIPQVERMRVFERFARLDEARARDAGGTGLGLAIVQKVVEDAGGSVEVDDSDLGGARFRVVLPTPDQGS
ncbi:ATP-binding protein [Marmoricola sp. RAF53]|uniref:ATP-binding protein n=1 Tax=Marmoricola sp. RAF53 TaxID=3233059 RepID=UPI003F9E9172